MLAPEQKPNIVGIVIITVKCRVSAWDDQNVALEEEIALILEQKKAVIVTDHTHTARSTLVEQPFHHQACLKREGMRIHALVFCSAMQKLSIILYSTEDLFGNLESRTWYRFLTLMILITSIIGQVSEKV